MIDLKNTKIDCTNKNGKVNESINHAYIKACEKQGIKLNISLGNATSASYLYATSEFSPECGIEYSGKGTERYFLRSKEKQITLADIKPKKTKVEFVMCNGSIFDLKEDFESGKLYCQDEETEDYCVCGYGERNLIDDFIHGNIFRKVETEITWQEELYSFMETPRAALTTVVSIAFLDSHNDLSESAFIEMCRVVIAAVDGK